MDVDRLRAETRPEHEATEATLSLMSADLTLEQYVDALRRLYTVLHAWEVWAGKHAPPRFLPLLAARRRSKLIEADLTVLKAPAASQDTGAIEEQLTSHLLKQRDNPLFSPERFLGAMYVVEGSTLGGQYIARHVEKVFGLVEGQGNAYFRGYGDQTGSMWRSFKDELVALPDAAAEDVIAAARSMFGVFGAAMASGDTALFSSPRLLSVD